jgi:hypothetical protein
MGEATRSAFLVSSFLELKWITDPYKRSPSERVSTKVWVNWKDRGNQWIAIIQNGGTVSTGEDRVPRKNDLNVD